MFYEMLFFVKGYVFVKCCVLRNVVFYEMFFVKCYVLCNVFFLF